MVAEVRDHDHGVVRQDAGEDLARPLVGQGLVLGAVDAGALERRRVVLGDVLVEALAAVAVGAAGDVDDHAALGKRCLGGAHALDGLVDVLVKRVAAVGGDGDVALDRLDAGELLHKFAAGLVGLVDVAGEGADDLVLAVQDHVKDEGEVRHLGGGEHVLAHVVVAQVAGAGVGVVHELAVVVVHDRLVGGDARQDGLAAAGEPCKEVRLDEALGKEQVGVGSDLVDDALASGRQGADLHHHAVVGGDVHDDLLVCHDVLAVLVDELLVCGGAVHTSSHEDAHAGLGSGGVDATQQDGHRHARGNRARVVRADDDDVLLASAELLKLGRAVGVVERILDELLLALAWLELVLVPLHKPGEVLLVEAQMHCLVVVGQIKLIHGVRSFFLTRRRSGHGVWATLRR